MEPGRRTGRSILLRVYSAEKSLGDGHYGSVHTQDYWLCSPCWKCRWSNALPYVQRRHFYSGLATAYKHRQRSAISIPSMESQPQSSRNRGGEVTAICTDVSSVCGKAGQWREAEGKAYFIDDPQTGRLKVSFFGPFYGGYNIIRLDHSGYRYALVCGPDKSYLWLLARSPDLDRTIVAELVSYAAGLGFDTSQLIYVRH